MTIAPNLCDGNRNISSNITTNSLFKSSGTINLSCIISNNANTIFKAVNEANLLQGFEVSLGSSCEVIVDSNINPYCP
jgi:hypothetical protein